MPIYEFYCADCHTIYNFFARSINTTKRPKCPKCGRPRLERQISRFAISKGLAEPSADNGMMPDVDDAQMEKAMAALAEQADGLDEDNPRQMGRLMRQLMESTGMPMNDAMHEAIRRMEAGEDPDKIEEQLGDLMDEGEFADGETAGQVRSAVRRFKPPKVDETLYDL